MEVTVPPEISAEVSRDQILMTIANVVKNAFESYTDGGKKWRAGEVRIGARVVDDEWLELVVQDDGQGMHRRRPGGYPAVPARQDDEEGLGDRLRPAAGVPVHHGARRSVLGSRARRTKGRR